MDISTNLQGACGASSCVPAPATGWTALDIASLRSGVRPATAQTDFVGPGLATGECGILTGPSGLGKSIFSQMLVASVASGRDLMASESVPSGLGMPCRTGGRPVAYLGLEDGIDILWDRMRAMFILLSVDEQADFERNASLYASPGTTVDILSPSGYADIKALATDKALVVLDTLSCLHSVDENDTTAMLSVAKRFAEIASSTGAALLILHHVSKNAIANGLLDTKMAARGASSFVNSMRWQGSLAPMTAKDAKKYKLSMNDALQYVRFCIPTQHHGPRPPDIWLKQGKAGLFQAVQLQQSKNQKPKEKARDDPSTRENPVAMPTSWTRRSWSSFAKQ